MRVLLRATPINWPSPGNDITSLTMYTTHTRASGHKHIYIYLYIYIVQTCGKAIIGMALRAIKKWKNVYGYQNWKSTWTRLGFYLSNKTNLTTSIQQLISFSVFLLYYSYTHVGLLYKVVNFILLLRYYPNLVHVLFQFWYPYNTFSFLTNVFIIHVHVRIVQIHSYVK